jgi:pyruvate formate-lyase activating enzyme-like uncharacterized protein
MNIEKTKWHSWKKGSLARGCRLCVQGKKLVLFVTGLCPRHCYYCPLSEKKWHKDVIYANEWKIASKNDLIEEAKLTEAEGAGITGGDPLAKIERTASFIKLMKKKFGKKFHIHLYTSLDLVNEKKLKMLYTAGLDEIRIHPDIYSNKLWHKIDLIKKFNWKIVVEIPAIPSLEKQTFKLIDFFKDKIDFLNINELEISDTNAQMLVAKGFRPKNRVSYGVKGSEELAKKILRKYNMNIHYCTTTLKDKIQLARRIKRRARNVAKKFDKITKAGTLIRGAIYLPELLPSFGYAEKLEKMNKKPAIDKLKRIALNLQKDFKLKKDMLAIDTLKPRILTSESIARKLGSKLKARGLRPAVVEQYPTQDQLELDIMFL